MATSNKRDSDSDSDSDRDFTQRTEKPGLDGGVVTHQPMALNPYYGPDKPGLDGGVVTQQPMALNAMPSGVDLSNCPPGLEYLAQIDQLICKQKVHLTEVFLPWEKKNSFVIHNSMGQPVYTAREDSTCFQRQCCGNARGFRMRIEDNSHTEVMVLSKKFVFCSGSTCSSCCADSSCAWELAAETPTGETLGYVRQGQYCCCPPKFTMLSSDRSKIGEIIGPCCMCNCPCCGDIEFPMYDVDGQTVIGKVAKQWSGAAKEIFTDSSNFCASFPMGMDIRSKASVFAATFLIDMMFFET